MLPELLAARDARYALRRRLAGTTPSFVEVGLNVPGWPKTTTDLRAVFDWALAEVSRGLPAARVDVREDAAGFFALYVARAPAAELKVRACAIEQSAPWGRLVDIDCYDGMEKISRRAVGRGERACLVCPQPHDACTGDARHDPAEVRRAADALAAACARAFAVGSLDDTLRSPMP